MGKIYVVMGKSASGKDTIYKRLLEEKSLGFQTVTGYTTRPIRAGETEGVEYHFVTTERFFELKETGSVVESRVYHTVLGDWYYFTVADGQIDLKTSDYLMLNTLEGYKSTVGYYGKEQVVPIYISVEDGERLERALKRERQQAEPNYKEMCRRYLADEEDFSPEKLLKAGIEKQYENNNLEECLSGIINDIEK